MATPPALFYTPQFSIASASFSALSPAKPPMEFLMSLFAKHHVNLVLVVAVEATVQKRLKAPSSQIGSGRNLAGSFVK